MTRRLFFLWSPPADLLRIEAGTSQVPTYRANPLTPACDTWCDFPVADRPNAVRQWIAAAEKDPSMIQVSLASERRWHSRASLAATCAPSAVFRTQANGTIKLL